MLANKHTGVSRKGVKRHAGRKQRRTAVFAGYQMPAFSEIITEVRCLHLKVTEMCLTFRYFCYIFVVRNLFKNIMLPQTYFCIRTFNMNRAINRYTEYLTVYIRSHFLLMLTCEYSSTVFDMHAGFLRVIHV